MSPRAWMLFAAVSVLWGIPYLFIKLAVDELSPAFIAWSRCAIAAAVLLPLAARAGALRGLPRWPLIAFATVELIIPWPLIGFGEQHVASSFAATLIATVPLFVIVISLRRRTAERPTPSRVVGLSVGLAGVAGLAGLELDGSGDALLGVAALLVAALGYAVGALTLKHAFAGSHPLGPIAGAMGVATVALAPLGLADMPAAAPSGEAIASLVILGLLCSALAFVLFLRLVIETDAGRATVITYVSPLVALVIGIPVLGEEVTVSTVAGLALILLGSWLATRAPAPQRSRVPRPVTCASE